MPTDLTIVLPDRPGALVAAWERLSHAGVNIEGACAFPERGSTWGTLHILVEEGDTAQTAVEAAGFQVTNRREVNVHDIEDRTGALAEIFADYLAASKNVDLMYLASDHRVVIGTDDGHQRRSGYTTLGEKRDG